MRRSIAVILTLVIISSSFSPLGAAVRSAGEAFCGAVAASSTILSCFSVTAVPFALLSGLTGKDFSLNDSFYPFPQDHKDKNSEPVSHSSDAAFTASVTSMKAPAKGFSSLVSIPAAGTPRLKGRPDLYRHDPGGGPGVVVLLLLAYLVLLSRSNLPPAACRAIALCGLKTQPERNGWVSSFMERTS